MVVTISYASGSVVASSSTATPSGGGGGPWAAVGGPARWALAAGQLAETLVAAAEWAKTELAVTLKVLLRQSCCLGHDQGFHPPYTIYHGPDHDPNTL